MEAYRNAGQYAGQAQALPTGASGTDNYESSITDSQHVPVEAYHETGAKKSEMRFFCYAKVANNKKRDSITIEFFPMEHIPFVDGEVNEDQQDYQDGGEEFVGGGYNANVKSSNALPADWLREGQSNRMTPPDVRRGERVKIWQYADSDKYYWETFGVDNDLRKLETVVFAYNANPIEDTKTDFENSYSLEISTHDKVIRMHTSDKNGEFCTYDIEINPGEGYVLIQDSIGNYIHMESRANRIELMNASGSHYDMDKEHITETAPGSHTIKTPYHRIEAAQTVIAGNLGVTGVISNAAPQITPLHALGSFADPGPAKK